jgi:hypothetical protein
MLYYAHQSREKMLGASRARAETVSAEQQKEMDRYTRSVSTHGPLDGRSLLHGICRLQQSKAQIVEELNVLRRKLDAANADNAALKDKNGAQAIGASAAAATHGVVPRALGRWSNWVCLRGGSAKR